MPTLLKYRVRCTVTNSWEFVWQDEDDPAPAVCPADPAHAINGDATSVVATVGDSVPTDDKGRPFAVTWPTEGSKSTKISHRWNDPTRYPVVFDARTTHITSIQRGYAADLPVRRAIRAALS